jgi:hypothetical protein
VGNKIKDKPRNGGKQDGSEKRVVYDERTRANLQGILDRVAMITEIQYTFTDFELVVTGLDPAESITFTNWRAAKAGLELYLLGYDHGFGDGRKHQEDSK